MQSLAAYSFEATVGESCGTRLEEIDAVVDEWLGQKGVASPRDSDGDFLSKTGDGTGQFSRRLLSTSVGSLREIELLETAHNGAVFTTIVQIAAWEGRIAVFATLSATLGAALVAPIRLYPRCPWIIRALIQRSGDWKFGGQEVPVGVPFEATTKANVEALCDALRSPSRRLPIVVVSVDEDEVVWPDLPEKLADQLIGLADVAYVNAESSWLLTDELGQQNSCYLGAVRLYWPTARTNGTFDGISWRAGKLASFGEEAAGLNKFLSIARRTVMATAALTMVPPRQIRDIQNAATKERLQALTASQQEEQLNSIVAENARLSAELGDAKDALAALQWKLAALQFQRDDVSEEAGDASDEEADSAQYAAPAKGEVRYYKKVGSGGGVDALVQTGPCNHKAGNWKPAFKGDQAEKGLHKLEKRNDWQSIAHCSACTGGGRWRVHW